MTEVAK